MLKILTIILGMLIILTRGLIVLYPARFREFAIDLGARESAMRWTGVMLFALTALIYFALGGDVSGARAIMAIMGAFMFLGALLLSATPGLYARMLVRFAKLPDGVMRAMGVIGVGVGFLFIALGLACY